MALNWPNKAPSEVLDYKLDLSAALAGDTIDACIQPTARNVTVDTYDFDASSVTVWLSGGTEGSGSVSIAVTTTGGEPSSGPSRSTSTRSCEGAHAAP